MTVIEKILSRKGLSVHGLHKRIGGNRTLVYQNVAGRSAATKPQRQRIADALKVAEDELFDGSGMARRAE